MANLVNESGSHKLTNRYGETKRQAVAVSQQLYGGRRRGGKFWALIRDPETGEVLNQVILYQVKPGESVEMMLEFELTDLADKNV